MKSRTSCFEPAIAKSLLRRFWPLWLVYTLALLLIPLALFSGLKNYRPGIDMTPGLNYGLGQIGETLLVLSFFAGLLAAIAVFSFLYSQRSCGLMASLPVTRSCLFLTSFITGLFPLLASDLLAAAFTAVFCTTGYLEPGTLMIVFASFMLSTVFFYGFACFCAMLTGNVLVLPAVYLVLNFTAVAVESASREILRHVLYGMTATGGSLDFLSPLVRMFHAYTVEYHDWPESVKIGGLGTVGVYALVGLLFALLAWRLFLRRRMETAGDTISIPVLKPIFVYCMTFGTALLFAGLLYDLLDVRVQGLRASLTILAMLLAGAFLGYFTGRMIAERSFRVFRGHWKGLVLSACTLVLLVGACEFDVLGYERRVPQADEIESVSFDRVTGLHDADTIESILTLHDSLVAHKAWHESSVYSNGEYVARRNGQTQMMSNLTLRYRLKNGETLVRGYKVFADDAEMADPGSDICRMEEIYNLPETLQRQCETAYPIDENTVIAASLHADISGPMGVLEQENVTLSPEELLDLWTNGVLPDVEEGHFARTKLFEKERDWQETNVELTFMLVQDREKFERGGGPSDEGIEWHEYAVATDSAHTLEWILEHTQLEPEPRAY